MRRKLLALFAVLAFTVPLHAQDATPEPTPEPPPVEVVGEEPAPPNIDEALENLLRVVFAAGIALFIDAPITVVIVSIIKRVKELDFLSAQTWTAIVAVLLWLLLTVAQMAGYEVQFDSLLKTLETVLPAIASLVFALLGAGGIYQLAVRNNAPVVSYQKPPARQAHAAESTDLRSQSQR